MESIYSSIASSVNNENRWTELSDLPPVSGAMSSTSGMPNQGKQVSPLSSKQCVDMNHHHFNTISGKRYLPDDTIADTSDVWAGPLKKRAKLTSPIVHIGGVDNTAPLAMHSMAVPLNLLPMSALTSAAAFLQPDVACQLLLSGGTPGATAAVAPTTQQQMLADIIASEMELLEATAKVKAAIAKKNQATNSANVPMTADPVATISASSSKDNEDGGHASMSTPASSLEKEDTQIVLRKPSARMVALHNYWVQTRRAPTLEP